MFLCVWLNAVKISNITTQTDFIYIILSFYHLRFLFSHVFINTFIICIVPIYIYFFCFLSIFFLNVKSIYGCFNLIFGLEGKLAAKHFSWSILSFFMRMRIVNCLVEGEWKFYSLLCSFLLKSFFVLLLFSFSYNIPDIYISNFPPLSFLLLFKLIVYCFMVIFKILFVGRYKLFA